MRCASSQNKLTGYKCLIGAFALLFGASATCLAAQQSSPSQQPTSTLPESPGAISSAITTGTITGIVTDTSDAAIPGARITLEDAESKPVRTALSEGDGGFSFPSVAPGTYVVRISAAGFSSWKIRDVIVLHEAENFAIPSVELGVESINTS